ncbi:MAG: ATP-binding protein [Ilumatobacteraceae bacterium]
MRLRLFAGFLGVALLILTVFSAPMASFVSRAERDRLVTELERDAFILAGHAKETLATSEGAVLPSLEPYVDAYDAVSDARVVVTNSAGRAISSNDPAVVVGESFANRPEIADALGGQPATGERESRTLGETLVFVAVPVLSGDDVLGAVRLSHPKSHVDDQVRRRVLGIVGAGAISLLAAAAVAVLIATSISRPVGRLRRATETLGRGDFDARADDSSGPREIRDLARSFNAMSGRLGLMVEHQRQFAGSVSHQLRTPLTALRLRLEQAEESVGRDNPAAATAIEASRAEADRLQDMVEQLLALARLEGAAARTVEVDAVRVVRDRLELWGPLAEERGVTVSLRSEGSARCAVVEGGLEQIIDNYMDNAISVSPAGSVIDVSVTVSGERVVIDVVDAGPGLTDEQRELAFDRFWRGPGTTGESGSGLGLAIVRQLAVASGGEAELLGSPGGGIRARLRLAAR